MDFPSKGDITKSKMPAVHSKYFDPKLSGRKAKRKLFEENKDLAQKLIGGNIRTFRRKLQEAGFSKIQMEVFAALFYTKRHCRCPTYYPCKCYKVNRKETPEISRATELNFPPRWRTFSPGPQTKSK